VLKCGDRILPQVRYAALATQAERFAADGDMWKVCQAVLGQLEGEEGCRYQFGKNRVFMSVGAMDALESRLRAYLARYATKLQAMARMVIARARYRGAMAQHLKAGVNRLLTSDDLGEIRAGIRKLNAMPEFRAQRRTLIQRMDAIMLEIAGEMVQLTGRSIRMGEYLRSKRRVGPIERKSATGVGRAQDSRPA
jgi:myosin heavy subunit